MDRLPHKQDLAARGAALFIALGLAGCGGGGGSPNDVVPGPQPNPIASSEPNSFLLFPNPQKQADGTLQTNTLEYAEAYYRAIDPLNCVAIGTGRVAEALHLYERALASGQETRR